MVKVKSRVGKEFEGGKGKIEGGVGKIEGGERLEAGEGKIEGSEGIHSVLHSVSKTCFLRHCCHVQYE